VSVYARLSSFSLAIFISSGLAYNPDLPPDYLERGFKLRQVLTKSFPTYRAQSHILNPERLISSVGFTNDDLCSHLVNLPSLVHFPICGNLRIAIDLPGGLLIYFGGGGSQ
jgi:hypothetical protein